MPSASITNFCSEGKDMLQLSVVHYQVLLCLDTYITDAIATNKQYKLKIRYFTIHLVISQQQSQFFLKYKYGV